MAQFYLLLALRTGGASSLDPKTTPFESGIPKLVRQSRGLSRGILRVSSLFLTLPTRRTLGLVTAPSRSRTQLHSFPPNIPSKFILIYIHRQIQMAGSGTLRVPYCIGYLRTAVLACIHLLFAQYLRHPMFGQFLLVSRTLLLELAGPRFSIPHSLNLSVLWNTCLYFDELVALVLM